LENLHEVLKCIDELHPIKCLTRVPLQVAAVLDLMPSSNLKPEGEDEVRTFAAAPFPCLLFFLFVINVYFAIKSMYVGTKRV
jgi:hypothetical protein